MINILSKYCDLTEHKNIGQIDIFDDLGLDSMQLMMILMDIEQYYQIEFDADDYEDRRIKTIDGIMEIVSARKD